jgi:hypothetical protein
MTRRQALVAAILIVLIVGVGLSVKTPHVYGYRVIDDHNIALQVVGARPLWRAVTTRTETSSTVTVGVSEVWLQLAPGFDDTIAYVVAGLADPLGTRVVIDASTGTAIPELKP